MADQGLIELEEPMTVKKAIEEIAEMKPDHLIIITVKDEQLYLRTTTTPDRADFLADILAEAVLTLRANHAGLKH